MSVLVAGAGGFIGGHLVKRLLGEGRVVRAVDSKPFSEWWQKHDGAENYVLDLSLKNYAEMATFGCFHVYNLAADMGGIGFIENNKAACMLSVLTNTHLLQAARNSGVKRYFYASSACVYAANKQQDRNNPGLKEEDAYPAMPEDGYGWEKLFSERMCYHFMEDYGLETRVARFHNVYGPYGTYQGGREKAPAAICRKVAEAKFRGKREIEIWGDGGQTRSFMYVGDCVEGIRRIMDSDVTVPLNLGSTEMVTINQLTDLVEKIAGHDILVRKYNLNAPKGVNGRNSDNSLIKSLLDWEPSTPLLIGMPETYLWVESQVRKWFS